MQIRFRFQAIIPFCSEDFPPPPAGAVLIFFFCAVVAMGIPKQGVNMSTIAIDNFIFHPFSGHGSPRAVPLQLAAAHWPVKSGEHKSSIIAN